MRILKVIAAVATVLLLVLAVVAFALYRYVQEPKKIPSREEIEREKGVAVEVQKPTRRDMREYLFCDGAVDARVRRVLRAQIDETVEAVHVDVGDSVQRGQLLVEFRKGDLEAEVEASRTAYEEASNNLQRYEGLFEEKVVSRDVVEARRTRMQGAAAALQRAESELRFARVRAPIGKQPGDGEGGVIVEARHVEPGERKGAKDALLTLVDLSEIEIRALVPETGLSLCGPGTRAEFRLEGEPSWRTGVVARVSPSTVSPDRFFDVLIETQNRRRNGRWVMRVGMCAEVRFTSATAEDALVVRAGDLRREGDRYYVFRLARGPDRNPGTSPAEDGRKPDLRTKLRALLGMVPKQEPDKTGKEPEEVWKTRRVEVQTGLRAGGHVQLLGEAVSGDDWIVSDPRVQMREGVKVNVVKGMEGQSADQPGEAP